MIIYAIISISQNPFYTHGEVLTMYCEDLIFNPLASPTYRALATA